MRRPIYRLERDKQYFNSRFDPSGLGRTVLQIPDEIRHESCFGVIQDACDHIMIDFSADFTR